MQSARYDRRPTRAVIPLLLLPADNAGDRELTPHFLVEGRTVFLSPLRILTVPISARGPKVASLADDVASAAIVAAIDVVISRAYG